MNINRPGISVVIVAPDLLQKLFPAENATWMTGQKAKQRKLLSGQLHFLVFDAHFVLKQVNLHILQPNDLHLRGIQHHALRTA